MQLEGVIALVTGGSSGMGAEISRQLANNGARVAIFDLNEDAAVKVAKEINGFAVKCNVADGNSVESAFKQVKEKLGVPRVCVNCAGIATAGKVVNREGPMNLDEFKKVIDINLIGTFNVLRLVAYSLAQEEPVNEEGERGVIINTASIAAFEGQIGQAAYSASKGGITSMTLPIARELSKFGIRVVTICPGLIDTPMMASLPEAVKTSLLKMTVFPKRLGQASEFAKLVCHIVDNPLINGEIIRLDGAVRLPAK